MDSNRGVRTEEGWRKNMETVGFVGLGNMGAAMSRNIQRAGYPMVVYDVREAAGRLSGDGSQAQ